MERRTFLKGSLVLAAATQVPEWVWAGEKSTSATFEKPPAEVLIYNRIAFGHRPADLKRFHSLGSTLEKRLTHLIEAQLHPESLTDEDCEERIERAHLTTLKKSVKELWQDHFIAANKIRDMKKEAASEPSGRPSSLPPQQPKSGDFKGGDSRPFDSTQAPKLDENDVRMLPVREVEKATWIRAVYSERQLEQVLADFWHNHFNVYGWDNQTAPVFANYDRDVIRPHVLGNFREMLEAVSTSPAMLFYLDNFINQSGNPNENYARELFELHTLGAENYLGTKERTEVQGYAAREPVGYVDGDVYEAARCFTGWRVETGSKTAESGEFNYYDPWHDRFQKIVLGHSLQEYQSPMKDGRDVLDLLARHPGTSHFIARKLCTRFVSDTPSQALITRVAKVFRDHVRSKDQLKQTVRAVLLSPEFRREGQSKIKRPFEFIASAIRATGSDFDPTEDFFRKFSVSGQRLFQWRSPDGYPDTREKWSGSSSMVNRWRLSNQLANGNLDGVKITLPIEKMDSKKFKDWLLSIYGRTPSSQTLKAITHFYDTAEGNPKQKLQASLALSLMSPEFQWR